MEWEKCFAKCHLGDDGILYSVAREDNVASKFTAEAQNGLFEIEDTSWWFQYRAQVICQIAHKFLRKETLTFDVGGGNGYTTGKMASEGYLMALLEPSLAACQNAKSRGLQVICGTIEEETVIDGSLKQLLLLDVLEHIKDDGSFLRTMYCKLAPSGRVLLTVPAFQQLWSSEDDSARHYRRYRIKQLSEVVQAAGFSVLYINYFFEFLFLPILLVRVWMERVGLIKRSEKRTDEEKKRISTGQFKERKGPIQWVLNLFEKQEIRRLLGGKRVPFGSSLICVLEKR